MSKKLLFRLAVLMAAMMCALGASAVEAYACYTSSDKTLTFYYDNYRSSRPGTTYDMNTGYSTPAWFLDTHETLVAVTFDATFKNARPTSTYSWFYTMPNLRRINGISNLNTSSVTVMQNMFNGCSSLYYLDLSGFNTSNVTDMSIMFCDCSNLTVIDLSGFNTSKVTSMGSMFQNCSNLTTIYAGSGWTTDAVTNSGFMFRNCTSLVGGQGTTFQSSNPANKTYAHIDGGPSNPGYFTAGTEAYACYTPDNTTLTFYYDNLRSSRPGTTYDLNTGNNSPGWVSDGTNASVTSVVFDPSFADARPTSTYAWFYDMENLQSITGISYLNTSEVTNMAFMFAYASNLTSLDVSHFNTSNVTTMMSMFYYCSRLTSLDLSSFNTANVTGMSYMFYDCRRLTSLDLSSFNTSQVIDMGRMFYGCSNLRTIYVGNGWTTEALLNSTDMFNNCSSLVGGQGTTYDENHIDKAYAHIDGGPDNPGYFTDGNGPRPYACYTPSNTTLTFYYDSQRSSRPGTTYDLNTGDTDVAWDTDGTNASVTKVVFDSSFAGARPTTTYDWFYGMTNLQSITGLSYLNTSEVTNMDFMFRSCNQLTSLDVSHFNTSKVIYMNQMFSGCTGLTSLDLSSFNTANVKSMYGMFAFCDNLTSLDLSNWNTSKVTNMADMFYNSYNLRTVYVGNGWSTATVTESSDMFFYCISLVGGQGTAYNSSNPKDKTYAHIDGGTSNPGYFTAGTEAYACYYNYTLTFYYDNLRSSRPGTTYDLNTGDYIYPDWQLDRTKYYVTKVVFDPSFAAARPTSTFAWFYGMENLLFITGMKENLNTSEVTNMRCMFQSCTALTSLDVSHFNTSKVTDMDVMFAFCEKVESLDLSNFNTSNVTEMALMFEGCTNLRTIYVGSGWSTAIVTYTDDMFLDCTSLVGGQGTTYDANHVDAAYAHIDGGPSNPGYFTAGTEAYACYTPSNTTLTFYYDNLRYSRTGTTYDLNSGANFPAWFDGSTNENVTKVVFNSSFADARPTTTHGWFDEMYELTSVQGIENLNTSEVTDMAVMFGDCSKLTGVDVSHFDTRKVTTMAYMFYYCSRLTSLDVRGFDTGNVTDMSGMFEACAGLTALDVTNFNTGNVTNMYGMFEDCDGLTSLDLGNFNTSRVTDMRHMFSYCDKLRTIYVGNGWSTAAVTSSDYMFYESPSLVGGKGTTYDENHIDKAYAHIDGGPDNPGYFTSKSLRGDVNFDGSVNISDVSALINLLLTGGTPTGGADANQDGNVNTSDVATLIKYLLSGTWN